jgi:hypothetical protein
VPAAERTGAIPFAQRTFGVELGHVIVNPPPFTNTSVKPNAFVAGGLENETVVLPVNCRRKLLPVSKSIVAVPVTLPLLLYLSW